MRGLVHGLVGNSAALAEVIRWIARAAPTNSTVLIQGESGTGKELVAHALHQNSRRPAGPFIAVNCAALPETLLESEFFGHEKGAFTGAVTQKKGKLELATGGTLFLDEVGLLSPFLQAKLLRALQQREIDRIGGRTPIPIDIRLIAATNRNLESAVAQGDFREDLYYRLNVVTIRTPPLRERPEDIPALVRYFISFHSNGTERVVTGIAPQAESVLSTYHWPGNVRQLQNVIERAIVLGSSDVIQPEDLPPALFSCRGRQCRTKPQTLEDAVLEAKRQFVENVFQNTRGDGKQAAAILGIHPKGMRRFLDRLHLSHLMRRRRGASVRRYYDVDKKPLVPELIAKERN